MTRQLTKADCERVVDVVMQPLPGSPPEVRPSRVGKLKALARQGSATEKVERDQKLRQCANELNRACNQLNDCAREILSLGQMAVQLALRIGDILRQARALHKRNEFNPWLKKNCPRISRTYAYWFMDASLFVDQHNASDSTAKLNNIRELFLFCGIIVPTEGPKKGQPQFTLSLGLRFVSQAKRLTVDSVQALPLGERHCLLPEVDATIEQLRKVRDVLAAPASS